MVIHSLEVEDNLEEERPMMLDEDRRGGSNQHEKKRDRWGLIVVLVAFAILAPLFFLASMQPDAERSDLDKLLLLMGGSMTPMANDEYVTSIRMEGCVWHTAPCRPEAECPERAHVGISVYSSPSTIDPTSRCDSSYLAGSIVTQGGFGSFLNELVINDPHSDELLADDYYWFDYIPNGCEAENDDDNEINMMAVVCDETTSPPGRFRINYFRDPNCTVPRDGYPRPLDGINSMMRGFQDKCLTETSEYGDMIRAIFDISEPV